MHDTAVRAVSAAQHRSMAAYVAVAVPLVAGVLWGRASMPPYITEQLSLRVC